MTSTATTKTNNPSVTIYGNVGNDPETITFEARTEIVTIYDPTIDDLIEQTGEPREYRNLVLQDLRVEKRKTREAA